MPLDSLLKMFEEYGWPGMLAIICVIVLYYFVSKKDKKSLETINSGFVGLTKTIMDQNDNLITAITSSNEKTQERLFTLINKSIDNKEIVKERKHKKSLAKRTEISEFIDDTLFEILQTCHAQRVILLEFHNSKENLDGLSFLWYDAQHEKQEKGIPAISMKARNLQATNLRPIIYRVNNDKSHIICIDKDDIESIYNESTVLYSHYKEINAEHIIYCGIYNTDTNELLGLVVIEYQEGHTYIPELIDPLYLKEKIGLIEHLYNQARKSVDDTDENSEDVNILNSTV